MKSFPDMEIVGRAKGMIGKCVRNPTHQVHFHEGSEKYLEWA